MRLKNSKLKIVYPAQHTTSGWKWQYLTEKTKTKQTKSTNSDAKMCTVLKGVLSTKPDEKVNNKSQNQILKLFSEWQESAIYFHTVDTVQICRLLSWKAHNWLGDYLSWRSVALENAAVPEYLRGSYEYELFMCGAVMCACLWCV